MSGVGMTDERERVEVSDHTSGVGMTGEREREREWRCEIICQVLV